MNETSIRLKPSAEKRISKGHPWIFSNEIEKIDTSIEPGTICTIYTSKNDPIGIGFFNPHSLISVRILETGTCKLQDNFISDKITKAIEYRKSMNIIESGRMFFGESDGIGGLVIDKYQDFLVIEILSAGVEKLKNEIIKCLVNLFKPRGIFLKNTNEFRKLEGLNIYSETVYGNVPENVEISENGVRFNVPIKTGQKTGFYFDQRENRTFLIPYFKDRKVLDLYCYIGAFSILAAKHKAKFVWGIDSSETFINIAKSNAKLNHVEDKIIFKKEDAEKMLIAMSNKELPECPDFILIDPPNLVRNKKHIHQSTKLYVHLNTMALSSLSSGGLLATSSCSHHITREMFMDIIYQSCAKSGKKAILMELRGQSKDHPVLINMPETEYLHFALLKVM